MNVYKRVCCGAVVAGLYVGLCTLSLYTMTFLVKDLVGSLFLEEETGTVLWLVGYGKLFLAMSIVLFVAAPSILILYRFDSYIDRFWVWLRKG